MDKQTENNQDVLNLEEIEKTLSRSFYTTLAISVVAALFLSVLLGVLFLFGMGTIAVISFAIFVILIWAVFETGAHHIRRKLLPDLAAMANKNRQICDEAQKMAMTFQKVLREREGFWINIANQCEQHAQEAIQCLNFSAEFINFVTAKFPEVIHEYNKFKAEQSNETPESKGGGNETN